MTKEIECDCPHNRKIGRGIAITQGSLILLENSIFRPMQSIFDVPMLANLCGKPSRVQGQRTEIKDSFLKRLLGTDACSLHPNQALHTNPLRVNSGEGVEDTDCPLGGTGTCLFGLTIQTTRRELLKLAFEMFIQGGLIGFDGN